MEKIIKFFITGFPRTGTTYIAALLNSQKKISCVESNLEVHRIVKNPFKSKSKRDLNILCTELESHFVNYSYKPPDFRSYDNIFDIKETYYRELQKIFKSDFIGTKTTRASLSEIKNLIKEEVKVIITTRSTKEVIKSSYNKFDRSTLLDLAIKLKNYKKDLNNYNLSEYKNILIVNLNEFKDNQESLNKVLSNFFEVEIKTPEKLYHSWNKNRGDGFFQNSSFSLKDNTNLINLKISDYTNYVDNNKISISLIFPLFLEKYSNILKKIGKLFLRI